MSENRIEMRERLPDSNNLQNYRIINRYTRKAVAEKLGVNPITIWRWETGLTIPTADKIWQICALFTCEAKDIYPELF